MNFVAQQAAQTGRPGIASTSPGDGTSTALDNTVASESLFTTLTNVVLNSSRQRSSLALASTSLLQLVTATSMLRPPALLVHLPPSPLVLPPSRTLVPASATLVQSLTFSHQDRASPVLGLAATVRRTPSLVLRWLRPTSLVL